MNKRELQKKQTREKIIQIAKAEFIENGFLKSTTANIAKRANVAHGTIFAHFPDKEVLIVEVFLTELKELTDQLHVLLQGVSDIEVLLLNYLDFLEKEELFFAVLAKELPYYPEKLRSQIFYSEGAVRGYFYQALETGIKNKIYKDVDITTTLTFLFGTINYLLCNSESLVGKNSVIKEKRDLIKETFIKLINR